MIIDIKYNVIFCWNGYSMGLVDDTTDELL